MRWKLKQNLKLIKTFRVENSLIDILSFIVIFEVMRGGESEWERGVLEIG